MEIRDERAEEEAAIGTPTAEAFRNAAHASGAEAAIVAALRAAGALTPSLVAVEGGRIVGHVAISPVAANRTPGAWFGPGPASVEPARQRRGSAARLSVQR